MSEEKRKILDMLSGGKISSEEAEKLLDAVDKDAAPPVEVEGLDGMPRYLYVRVEPKDGAKSADQVKVTVPLALVKAGINFFSLLPKDARNEVESAMHQGGFDFDMKNMDPAQVDILLKALQELVVDVETADSTVKVYTG